jgi:hypothetical protein
MPEGDRERGRRIRHVSPARVVQRVIEVIGLVLILGALIYAAFPFKVQEAAPPAPKKECRPALVQVFDRQKLTPPAAPGLPPGPPVVKPPRLRPEDPEPVAPPGVVKPCTAEARDRLYWAVPIVVVALVGTALARRIVRG